MQEGGNICPTIQAESNGLCRIEPVIAASRGRNPSDPSDRTAGKPTEQRLEIGVEVSNTLTSVAKDNYVVEPVLITGLQEHQSIKTDGVCNALPAAMGMGGGYTPMVLNEPQIRIRKLTPKETWRLMGFSDEDFEKAEKVNSNSQLYKQAGNSIVVNVLMEIFKEMI